MVFFMIPIWESENIHLIKVIPLQDDTLQDPFLGDDSVIVLNFLKEDDLRQGNRLFPTKVETA
jgi:hypothetical protein